MNTKTIGMAVAGALMIIVSTSTLILQVPTAQTPAEKTLREMAFDCITHEKISYHVHPDLKIEVNGENEKIPADIGVTPECMRTLHTHDDTGKIHIEYPTEKPFTLGDFFAVWDRPLEREGYRLKATLNGEAMTDPEAQVVRDGDQILLSYTSISL